MADRLLELDRHRRVIATYHPDFSAVEEIFVNVNPQSTLKAGAGARGGFGLSGARGCRSRNIRPRW
jgi:crossover junction endodeoxyribonuclease RuvC